MDREACSVTAGIVSSRHVAVNHAAFLVAIAGPIGTIAGAQLRAMCVLITVKFVVSTCGHSMRLVVLSTVVMYLSQLLKQGPGFRCAASRRRLLPPPLGASAHHSRRHARYCVYIRLICNEHVLQ